MAPRLVLDFMDGALPAGVGIGGLGDPLYVVRLDPDARHVVVGPRSALDGYAASQ